jgi:hypothetical protein
MLSTGDGDGLGDGDRVGVVVGVGVLVGVVDGVGLGEGESEKQTALSGITYSCIKRPLPQSGATSATTTLCRQISDIW